MKTHLRSFSYKVFSSSLRCFSTSLQSSVSLLSPDDNLRLFSKLSPLILSTVTHHATLQSLRDADNLSTQSKTQLRRLSPLATSITSLHTLQTEFADILSIKSDPSSDHDLLQLAEEETSLLRIKLSTHITTILSNLLTALGEDTANNTNSSTDSIILELRAGTGGDEAALFVADLLSMYSKLSTRHRWRLKLLSTSRTSLGGYREAILRLSGSDRIPQLLTLEAGVHRVQRVPTTEGSGRVHTSTATVAVLPDSTNEGGAIKLKDADIKLDVYRASGAGGQHVNTTESAVRATHIPTGIVATSQEERSQHRNRALALQVLAARVAAKIAKDEMKERVGERRKQLGTVMGERSDRIRTYNFPQRRVTDHRIVPSAGLIAVVPSAKGVVGEKSASLQAVLNGEKELEEIIKAVVKARELEFLEVLINRAEDIRSEESDKLGQLIMRYMTG